MLKRILPDLQNIRCPLRFREGAKAENRSLFPYNKAIYRTYPPFPFQNVICFFNYNIFAKSCQRKELLGGTEPAQQLFFIPHSDFSAHPKAQAEAVCPQKRKPLCF